MLPITETANGQLTGALSVIEVKTDGKIESIQQPFTGAFDSPQITLTFPELFGHRNVSGTVTGRSVELQIMDGNGKMETWTFEHGSAAQFKEYTDAIHNLSDSITTNSALSKATRANAQTIKDAESWSTSSNLHASKMPGIEENYRHIENQMDSLIKRERSTVNGVDRSQLAVAVSQGDVAGSQFDIQVE